MTLSSLADALVELDLAGRVVCVHASMRSFAPEWRDPHRVIDAFLDAGATLLVPTFSYDYAVWPAPAMRPSRNGASDGYLDGTPSFPGEARVFTRESTEISADMGALPAALVRHPDRVRGNHPLMSFSALGPRAGDVADGQSPGDVFDPLRRLVDSEGRVVLAGVDLRRMTLLHLAEVNAGRRPFVRWANGPDGEPAMVDFGGCSEGFDRLEPVLAPVRADLVVEGSPWAAFPAAGALAAATRAIAADPSVTSCGRDCDRCRDAIAGGPLVA